MPSSDTYNILVAEDDESFRAYVEMLLRSNACTLLTAEDGQTALELYRANSPQLIITDIQMPVMDGYELISEIRKNDSQSPILAISSEKALLDKALDCGANNALCKDFSPAEFKHWVEKTLAA